MTRTGRRLLLLGGGPAQLFVLEALGRRRIIVDEALLIAPNPRQLHAGMVPGLVEGRYTIEQVGLDLPAICRAAGATFLEDTVVRIDAGGHAVGLAGGRTLDYDVAVIGVGAAPATTIPGVESHALLVKPLERADRLVPAMEAAAQNAGPEPLQVVVVGAGATGVQIALTTRARLDRLGANRAIITLVDSSNALLRHIDAATSEAAERVLRTGEITVRLSTGVDEVGPAHVRLTGGRVIPADLILWCAGGGAPAFVQSSGLPVDGHGTLSVNDTLAVPDTVGLFAAGDGVTVQHAARLPNFGDAGIRQGPVLAQNIALALGGGRADLARYRPPTRGLVLLDTGDGRAIFSYSGLVATAGWAMTLKDRLDRRYIRRFQQLQR